jgi:hypothetical protein
MGSILVGQWNAVGLTGGTSITKRHRSAPGVKYMFQEIVGRLLQFPGQIGPAVQAVAGPIGFAQKMITPFAQSLGLTQLRSFLVGEARHFYAALARSMVIACQSASG